MTTLGRQSDYCESALTIPAQRYKSTTRSLAEISHKILKKSKIIEQTISELLTKKTPLAAFFNIPIFFSRFLTSD